MITTRQAMEDGVSEVLSDVVEDVGQAVNRNITGAEILHELLRAPWLRSLLKIYECLLQFQRSTPSPVLPYATGLTREIMALIHKAHRPSGEARELHSLLSSPHIQALLSSHDCVAQSDYGPVLPPLPDELPEDEEAMRIVCLVKNNQPLSGGGGRGGARVGMIRDRWSSLRRLTLERLVPARRARSGEEIRATESDSRLLPFPKGGQSHPFLPRYESTGSCCLCPQTAELWKKGLNQSAPSVFSLAPCSASQHGGSFSEKPKPSAEEGNSNEESSDDYAYPPPPVLAYSLPNSPILYKKGVTGGQSRNIPTPGRTPSCPGMSAHQAHTAPCSPAPQRSTRQQGVSTMPTPGRPLNRPSIIHNSMSLCHSECKKYPKHTQSQEQHSKPDPQLEFTKQRSTEDLRSTVHGETSSIDHSTQDVEHLGQKMVAATEMITESMEENAQALNLLVEVVDKLQGLIVANKHPESSSPYSLKQPSPPSLSPRVSPNSPKVDHTIPRSYSHLHSSSSSTSCSSTSSSTSASSCATSRSLNRMNGGSKRTVVTFGATQRAAGSNVQGATIRRDEVTGGIYIARVIHGGLADRSGLLHPGDMLVEVNGNPVVGLEPEQVIQMLISSQGTILFKVIPDSAQTSSSQKPVYMKAMVDYCPLQDPSIPCPSAGMAFSRGDLLEVVDQSDGQWWQARKLPCAVSCAGLIPSASMLKSKQREQWWCQPLHVHTCIRPLSPADNDDELAHEDKRTLTDLEEIHFDEADANVTEGFYLAGFRRSFRLWRRTSYRRRRQSCTSCTPNTTLSTPYEEVVLYQRPPQENHRLIILVGASGVGVNELRKRLIKLNPATFQGPVPYTTRPIRAGEQTGREYHFVTKELFEYMVCHHRFVEYGEFRGHLYGISSDTIEDVLKRGRLCVIDVEAHSVQLLRTRTLKPYVIFIKAPSPERLRQTRRDAQIITNYIINRPITEEDFTELEASSRLIEVKYKQLFDSVLVNDDLQDSCIQLCSIIQQAQDEPQWIPVSWCRAEE